MKTKLRLTAAILAAFLMAAQVSADESRQNIRAVQQVLKDCGFNPGPVDGIWGNRTMTAAGNFLRAHGSKPSDAGYNIVMAQVDFYRAGDGSPCPDLAQADSSGAGVPPSTSAFPNDPSTHGEEIEFAGGAGLIAELGDKYTRRIFSNSVMGYKSRITLNYPRK